MPIGIKRLRYFLAVAEQGNINRAAESLHISQSALTRSIQGLEDSIGAILFQRTQRGVKLTTAGERLLDHARRITNTVRSAELDMEHLVRGAESEVRLGINSTLPASNILDAVFRLLTDLPNLSVTIVDSFYDSLVQRLRLEQVDMVLTALPARSDHEDLEVEVLREETRPMSVYARSGHPLLGGASVAPEALSQANWVVSGEPHYQDVINRYLLEREIPAPRFRLKCSSVAWMRRAILEEDFVALMSRSTVENDFPAGSVDVVPGSTFMTVNRIGLISSPTGIRPVGVDRLARELRNVYASAGPARTAVAGYTD
jgi:DNA-binding transcriptional LysR family regulator